MRSDSAPERLFASLNATINQPKSIDATTLFDWAESRYPELFPKGPVNQTEGPYLYRYYPANKLYLGARGDEVLWLGPNTDNKIVSLGKIADYTCFVFPQVCNFEPVANAGGSQNVVAGNAVTLDGSASSDANSDPLTYAWTLTFKPAGSSAILIQPISAKPSFTADVAGTYIASLVVNDGKVNSNVATVTITATTAPTPLLNSSPYVTYPTSFDESGRLRNADAAKAISAPLSAFSASPTNDYGWKMRAVYSQQGLFKVPVTKGYFYEFSSSSYWGPCLSVNDAAGYELDLVCAPSSTGVSGTRSRLLAIDDGVIYVNVISQMSYSFKNADLVIDVNTDSKGVDGGQQVDLSTFGTGPYIQYQDVGFYGGSGNDRIIGKISAASSTIYGGSGDDVIELKTGQYSRALVDGGEGNDTLVVDFPSAGIKLQKTAAYGKGQLLPGLRTDAHSIFGKLIKIRNIERIQFTDKTLEITTMSGF